MSNTEKKIQILDFEKPIYEMQKKIEELKNASSTTQINYDSGIESLEEQTQMYKKELYEKLEPYQKLQIARHPQRPNFYDYVQFMCDDFIELHGDRHGCDDKAIAGGICVGFICGFLGAGGGMMLLFVLTSFLGYPMHLAVGTSVFIMAFTALTGGVSHFVIGGMPDILCLVLCVVFTLVWARIAAKIANKANAKTLNRVVGIVMIVTSVVILAVNYL